MTRTSRHDRERTEECLLHEAGDLKALGRHARQLVRAPTTFDGTLEELCESFIVHNLPSAAVVEDFHHELTEYLRDSSALFLVRAMTGTERRQSYATSDGTRFRATDNAPVWWTHYALFQGCRVALGAFGRVVETMPTHMFDIARSQADSANAAGWHLAHIFDVKDRRIDFELAAPRGGAPIRPEHLSVQLFSSA